VTRKTPHNSAKNIANQQRAATQLQSGLTQMGLESELRPSAQALLLQYANELLRWNKAYNLTAVIDLESVVARHLLDSLSILPWLQSGLTLDVGTGAGLPGIPLAIARPTQSFVLLDSNDKRMRFLRHIVRLLSLSNVDLVTARAEQWHTDESLQQVVTRAFAPLPRQLEWCGSLLQQGAVLLAMTGKNDPEQLRNWPAGYTLRDSHALTIPGTIGARHLLEIIKA